MPNVVRPRNPLVAAALRSYRVTPSTSIRPVMLRWGSDPVNVTPVTSGSACRRRLNSSSRLPKGLDPFSVATAAPTNSSIG